VLFHFHAENTKFPEVGTEPISEKIRNLGKELKTDGVFKYEMIA